MEKNKIVTFAIIFLIALFALLFAFTFIPVKSTALQKLSALQKPSDSQTQGGAERPSRPQGENAQGGGRQPPSGNGQAQGQGPRGGARNAATIKVTTVSPGTIERSVIINGEILARNQVTIFPAIGGRLVETRRSIGDRVNRGDVVAMIDPSRPGEVYSRSPVISTVSGTVLQTPFSIGDTVTAQSAVFVVGDLSSLLVETHIPERFVAVVTQGLRAELKLEAMPNETFTAEVFEINPVLDPSSRTMRIRLRFIKPDPRIKAGMFATISLITDRKTGVPLIPRMSVINTYGSWIVFVADENNIARRREIKLGLDNEEFVEVLEGISMGDLVVSAGQNFLSDGDPVRIVD
ncbi:MAG: efflux RND transporter periplasmic adaptor subunit [Treponema sp.]|nr:efflux RND transporter periplasmic adaptor subunit [Treponema sp.]